MKFSEIKHKIKNLGNFKSLKEIKEAGLRIVRNTKTGDYWLIEKEFLKPVIKSPRECKSILIKPEDLKYKVLMVHKSKKELKGKKVLDYIEWGEKQKLQKRPTIKSRNRWYDLGEWKISKNVLPMFERARKYSFYNKSCYVDAALYWVYSKDQLDENILCLLLNSTLFGLWKELMARPPEGGGGGPIQMKAYHYEEMLVIKLELLKKFEEKLKNIFNSFIRRKIKSIFTELGFDPSKPIREQEPNPLPDRKALDDIVFDALGLTEEERKEVYWSVAELVKNRLEKAKNV